MTLKAKVDKQLSNFTVITTVLSVLKGHISAAELSEPFTGMTLTEVAAGYNEVARSFGKEPFYGSYIQRHAKKGDFFEEVEAGKYSLRPELIEDSSLDELLQARDAIVEHWVRLSGVREAVLREFEAVKSLPRAEIQKRREFIVRCLSSDRGSAGQNFEIMSFAILSTYFSCLGFSLRRFSTTFANDGGMDFICGEGIYQVTVRLTRRKVESDLAKLPNTKRVMVGHTIPLEMFREPKRDLLEVIRLDDLLNHFLSWLCERDVLRGSANHLQNILDAAAREYARE